MKYFIVLLSLSLSSVLHAQTIGWKQLPGSNYGQTLDIGTTKNGDVFAVSGYRLYRRDAQTKNWILCKTPFFSKNNSPYPLLTLEIAGAHYFCLAPGSSTPIDSTHGIYRSTDNGKSWQHVLSKRSVNFVSSSPLGGLYAVGSLNGITLSILFESKDNGVSWDSISSFPFSVVDFIVAPNGKCLFTVYAPEHTVLLYDLHSGLYKSLKVTDSITTNSYYAFLTIANGNPMVRFDDWIYKIKPDNTLERKGKVTPCLLTVRGLLSSPDGTLYTVTYEYINSRYVYNVSYSTDYGVSWNKFPSSSTVQNYDAIKIAVDSSGNFYMGSYYGTAVRVTTDKGNTWEDFGVNGINNTLLQEGPEGSLYISSTNSYNRQLSFDEGIHWEKPDSLPIGYYGYLGEKNNNNFFYFDEDASNTETRVWYADSQTPFSFTQQATLDIYTPLATGSYNNRYYIAAPNWYSPDLLLESTDLGINWLGIDVPVTGTLIRSFSIDSKGTLYLGYSPSLFRSSDDGRTWINVHTPIKNAPIIAIKFTEPKTIILGTSSDGVWHSTDDGANWSRWNAGGADSINTVEIYGGKCYAGSQTGLFSCTLTSNNWQHELLVDEELPILQLLNYQDKRLYASVGNLGIWTNDLTLRSVTRSVASTKLLTVFTDPFSGSTTILLNLTNPEHVVLDLYDILGHKVTELANSDFASGEYHIPLKGVLPSGVYTILLRTQREAETEKIVIAH